MCILIVKPAGKKINKKNLQECFRTNPHGAGFAYVNTDNRGISRVTVKKAMTFSKFYKQYKKALGLAPESNFLIHFRISTGGVTSEYNNHPFMIKNRKVAFGHNGTIPKIISRQVGEENDTRAFNREILKRLPSDWYKNKAMCELVGEYVGWSKLAVLDSNNKYAIINESKGNWDEGVWYSNSSYKIPTYSTYGKKSGEVGKTVARIPTTPAKTVHYPYSGNNNNPSRSTYKRDKVTGSMLYECSYCDDLVPWAKTWYTELSGMTCVCSKCKQYFIQRNHLQETDFSVNPIAGVGGR